MSTPPHATSDGALWHMSVKLQHSHRPWTLHKHRTWKKLCRDCVIATTRACERSSLDFLEHPSSALAQAVQAQLLGDFGRSYCIRQFLLNGWKPALRRRAARPRSMLLSTTRIRPSCSLTVLASHGPDLVLAFHVPHGET